MRRRVPNALKTLIYMQMFFLHESVEWPSQLIFQF